MHYTIHQDPEIDGRIERDLKIITETLINRFDSIDALILVGGFGRGEGSVIFESGQPTPLNDYDIVIITNTPLPQDELKKCSKDLVDMLGIRLIDLIPLSKRGLKNLPFTMFNYDMKYGSYVFCGDPNIISEMPERDPKSMPLIEGKILLFNRLICPLESFSIDFLKREPEQNKKFFLVNQSGKTILACADALLVLNAEYHHNYKEKCKRFIKSYPNDMERIKLVKRAAEFKLKPQKNIGFDTVEYWFQAKEFYEETFKQLMAKLYNRDFNDWIDFCNFYASTGLFRKLLHSVFRSSLSKTNIEIAEILILFSINKNSIDSGMLKKASKIFKYPLDKDDITSWNELRKVVVKRWFLNH